MEFRFFRILVDSHVHGSRSKIIAQNIQRYARVRNNPLYKSLISCDARKLLYAMPKFRNIELKPLWNVTASFQCMIYRAAYIFILTIIDNKGSTIDKVKISTTTLLMSTNTYWHRQVRPNIILSEQSHIGSYMGDASHIGKKNSHTGYSHIGFSNMVVLPYWTPILVPIWEKLLQYGRFSYLVHGRSINQGEDSRS